MRRLERDIGPMCHLVNLARGLFDTPLMFVALFTLMLIALSLYFAVSALERAVLTWHWPQESKQKRP